MVKSSVANVWHQSCIPDLLAIQRKNCPQKKHVGENPVFVGRENVAVFGLFGEQIEGVKPPICGRKDDCEVAWKTYKT